MLCRMENPVETVPTLLPTPQKPYSLISKILIKLRNMTKGQSYKLSGCPWLLILYSEEDRPSCWGNGEMSMCITLREVRVWGWHTEWWTLLLPSTQALLTPPPLIGLSGLSPRTAHLTQSQKSLMKLYVTTLLLSVLWASHILHFYPCTYCCSSKDAENNPKLKMKTFLDMVGIQPTCYVQYIKAKRTSVLRILQSWSIPVATKLIH